MDSGIEIVSAGLPHKVSCIRWVPEQLDAPNTFLTSSWDSTQNSVTLWSQFHNAYGENDQAAFPEPLAVKHLPGDIVQFEFIDEKTIACVTSEGALNILSIATDMIEEKFAIPNLHQFDGFKAACTGVSVYDRDIATIGEDGCLKIVSVTVGEVLRTIKDKNTCSLCCISFVNPDTVLVSSRCGNIDCYDIRTDSDEPVLTLSTLSKTEDEDGLTDTTCISYQPVQNQIVFAGLEDGSIMGWDLRKPDIFSTHLKPHESSVNAIAFRRDDPKRMFSGTEGGEVFQWLLRSEYSLVGDYFDQLVRSYGPVIENYSAINSIDVNESHMICSGDDAFVHIFEIQEE
ncbi:nucleoporin Nup43 [Anopheles ziemanni]|uniref:nucleoporin Nup43 n=1 Tax=Anopheles coustani TaxID=139045 RepID=UPI00265B342E|nr:nucleoporin Nup43 [Anopheles coustani]XP_058172529.1 nucleoporin Nup43 [Anopheles ziemanni]